MSQKAKTTLQQFEHIPLNACIPTNYQRATSDRQVERIVREFDEAKLGVLTVSLRDGKYHIVDGLHRSKALKALGYTHAQSIVLMGLTYEQEADYFRRQNQNKRNVMTFDDFKAGLEAKNETCLRIQQIVTANRFQIGRGSFFKIGSVQALFAIVRDYGYDVLNDTLHLIAITWGGIQKASQRECLLGIAEFVSRYGMAEFTTRMKDKFSAVNYDYSETIRYRGSIGSASARKKFCRVLVSHYNKGLSSRSKKRLVWLE